MRIIKCSNPNCNERFRFNEVRYACNDYGYIVLRCKACKKLTRIEVPNPECYHYFENAEKIAFWEKGGKNKYQNEDEGESLNLYSDAEEIYCPWAPSSHALWKNGDDNYEILASEARDHIKEELNNCYRVFLNLYVKESCLFDIKHSIIIHHYLHKGIEQTAIWAKPVGNGRDINLDDMYLVHHSNMPSEWIDGLFTRDDIFIFLQRCLVRWRYLCNQVIIVTPFIGFFYKNNKNQEETKYLWKVLNELLDIKKTTFVTRKGTYTQLKNSQNADGNEYSGFLKEWGLFSDLQKAADNKKLHFVQKFHAKFYAGVFSDRVEVFSGSYNIQTGTYMEQVNMRTYTKEEFSKRYMFPLLPDFQYAENKDEHIHKIDINLGKGDPKNIDSKLSEIEFL